MRKIFINLLCALIPSRKLRHRMRMRMTFDIRPLIKFALKDANMKRVHIDIFQGHGGMKKVIVVLDKRKAYKFPLVPARYDSPKTEKMFTDAFREISPLKLPKMEIVPMNMNGKIIDVLKYDFVSGTPIGNVSKETLNKYGDKIARQLAEFLYAIGQSDPKSIKHLKPSVRAKPGFMYGWAHNDIGGNFLVNENTGKITAVIDWESAKFCDWSQDVLAAHKYLKNRNAEDIMVKTVIEYEKLYNSHK